MSKLTHEQWCIVAADGCPLCGGNRHVLVDGSFIACCCQFEATRKYRLEQIEINPNHLKYLDWADFTGIIKQDSRIEGSLTMESAKLSRDKAFEYCFGSPFGADVLKHRRKHNVVHKHLKTGRNVIIAGDKKSGKTMLAVLMLKEIPITYDYKWETISRIVDAARWDHGRPINHFYLDHLAELSFLFVDNVDLIKGGHNSPPDHISMNVLFGARRTFDLPTVLICSRKFLHLTQNPAGREGILAFYGDEFTRMITHPDNFTIELLRDDG